MTSTGSSPICRVFQVAESAYYAAKRRSPCVRTRRDGALKAEIVRVFEGNHDGPSARP